MISAVCTESDSSNGRLQPRSAFTLLPDLSCPRPANSFAEYAPEPNPATDKKDLLDQLLRQNQHDSDFALENACRNNRDVKGELVLHLGSGLLVLGIDVQNISVAIDWAHPVSSAPKSSLCWQTLAKTVGLNIPRHDSNEASLRPTHWGNCVA